MSFAAVPQAKVWTSPRKAWGPTAASTGRDDVPGFRLPERPGGRFPLHRRGMGAEGRASAKASASDTLGDPAENPPRILADRQIGVRCPLNHLMERTGPPSLWHLGNVDGPRCHAARNRDGGPRQLQHLLAGVSQLRAGPAPLSDTRQASASWPAKEFQVLVRRCPRRRSRAPGRR